MGKNRHETEEKRISDAGVALTAIQQNISAKRRMVTAIYSMKYYLLLREHFLFSSYQLLVTLHLEQRKKQKKCTCTQKDEKKWILVKRVSYASDFMDFVDKFLFLLLLSLSRHRFAFH